MSKITESAKGEQCQIRMFRVCNHDPATVVWAHANGSAAGKGVGLKTVDELGAYACFNCHNVYDRRVPLPDHLTRQDVEIAFHQGHQRSFLMLRQKGLV